MSSTKFLMSVLAFTISTLAAASVPSEVQRLMNRTGSFISLVDGKATNDHGTLCDIRMNPYGGESSIIINSVAYFTPGAHLDDAKKTNQRDHVRFDLNDNGKRPGGSICGDFVPLLSYKKWIEVYSNKLLIKTKYRCGIERSQEVTEGCSL